MANYCELIRLNFRIILSLTSSAINSISDELSSLPSTFLEIVYISITLNFSSEVCAVNQCY